MARRPRALLVLTCLVCLGFDWGGRLIQIRRDLGATDPNVRRQAVRALGSLPVREGGPDLLRALRDDDVGVRVEAARVAGRLAAPGLEEALVDWLDAPDARLRLAALSALAELERPELVPRFARALGDVEVEVRLEAVRALARAREGVRGAALSAVLDDPDPGVRAAAAEALGELGDAGAVMTLAGHAEDPDPTVRAAVLTGLGRLGGPVAVGPLLSGVGDADAEVRVRATWALGRLEDPRATARLLELSRSFDQRLARAALSALVLRPTGAAVEALVDAVARPTLRAEALSGMRSLAESPSLRQRLLMALAQRLATADDAHTTSLAGALSVLMREHPSEVPLEALRDAVEVERGRLDVTLVALAETGSERAAVPIFGRLLDPSEARRATALDAAEAYLSRHPHDGRAADPLLTLLAYYSGVTGPLPAPAPPSELTEDALVRRRVRLLLLIGQTGASRALPAVLRATSSADARERIAAVRAIGRLSDEAGARGLMRLLEDRDARVRFEVARALGRGGSVIDLRELVDRLQAPGPRDRPALLIAIGGILARVGGGPHAARVRRLLVGLATHRDARLAAAALDALDRWGDPRALSRLARRNPSGDPRLARRFASVLASGPSEVPLHSLPGGDTLGRVAALSGLGERRGREVLPRLVSALRDAPFPQEAAASFALARLARRGLLTAEDAPALCAGLVRRHPATRANLMVALAALGTPRCPDLAPARALRSARAPVVQAAAARWLAAVGGDAAQDLLRRCLDRALDGGVEAACREPALPPLDSEADVYAYGDDGESPLAGELVSLTLADSTVLVRPTDANAHLRLAHAPAGTMRLGRPEAVPLEP